MKVLIDTSIWSLTLRRKKDDLDKLEEKIVGCGRGHFNSQTEAQIRYMAVENEFSGKGIGTQILKALEKKLTEKGAKLIILNARENAVKFYLKHRYKVIEKGHALFGVVEHYKMRKKNMKRSKKCLKNKKLLNY